MVYNPDIYVFIVVRIEYKISTFSHYVHEFGWLLW